MSKKGFGISVEGLRGELSLPLPKSTFVHSQMEKDHLNIFLKKNRGFFEKPALMPNQANTLHPNPAPSLQPRADSGHARCKCPPGKEGSAIKWRVLIGRPATKPGLDLFSAGALQHSFRHFWKAQPVHGWYHLKNRKKDQSGCYSLNNVASLHHRQKKIIYN